MQYLTDLQINVAKRILVETTEPTNEMAGLEVADQIDFVSGVGFSRVFS